MYQDHLEKVHAMSPEQIAFLVELGAGSAPSTCLFCEEQDENVDAMHSHTAEHLREYAFSSLPWREVMGGSERVSKNAVANDGSKGVNSSILRMEDYKDEVSLSGSWNEGYETSDDNRDVPTTTFNSLGAFVASEKLDPGERQDLILSWIDRLSQDGTRQNSTAMAQPQDHESRKNLR